MKTGLSVLAVFVLVGASTTVASVDKYENEASFLGALSTPLHEDFDNFTSGQLVTSLPSVNVTGVSGINSVGDPVSQYVTAQADLPFSMLSGLDTSSLPNFFSNDLSAAAHFGTGSITFNFDSAMDAVGFFIADGSPLGTFHIALYDSGGLIAEIDSDFPKTLPNSFLGVTSTTPFNQVTFGSNSTVDSWGIDDLYLQVVPEPATIFSLLALYGSGVLRRRGLFPLVGK